MKLKPVIDRDAALKDHLEANHVFDETTGELADLTDLPNETPDPEEDEDAASEDS